MKSVILLVEFLVVLLNIYDLFPVPEPDGKVNYDVDLSGPKSSSHALDRVHVELTSGDVTIEVVWR